jgi:hypothetical protein
VIWPSYIREKGRIWAKHMGLKKGAVGNPWGTLWELWELVLSKNAATRLVTLIQK